MQHLFSPEGEATLAATLGRRPLLAFDFDGTLAPIVPRPEDARLSQVVASRLRSLGALLPLCIVTGRTVDDVRKRLGFKPRYIVGNHGAEDPDDSGAAFVYARQLDALRARLREHHAELDAAGVAVEDKGVSLALHYRLSRQREQALAFITTLVAPPDAAWRVFGGKMVVNVTAPDAPDKSTAVRALVARCGAVCAVFAGDDVNDEPVFESAPPDWLTIRIGRGERSCRARYFLDSTNEMAMLLQRMLALLPSPSGPREVEWEP